MSALGQLLNLRPGEAKKAHLFPLMGFLWSFGANGMLTLSEGTFLEYVGVEALPACYLIIALGLCLFSAISLSLFNRIPTRLLFSTLIIVWSGVLFAFYALSHIPAMSAHPSYWFAFRVMGWIIPISLYICFWAFLDQYFDLQEGKRFFAFFNSFLILGDFLAAAAIAYIPPFFGVRLLMLSFGGALLASFPLILAINRRHRPILDDHLDHLDAPPPLAIKGTLKAIVHSPFTLYLLLFYLVMQLLYVITEFNYMSDFENTFLPAGRHALTAFIGKCSMWISLGNMLLGFFAYSHLIKRFGVNNSILLAPSMLFLLFSCWHWKGGLGIATFAMVTREGMAYLIDDNNLNLLLTGVPTKVKNHVRITVESFFEPAGMLCSSALLFFLHRYARSLGWIVAGCALIIVFLLRRHYPHAIFQNLIASSIRFGKRAIDWIPKKERLDVEYRLLAQLKQPHEKSQLLAFEHLLSLEKRELLTRLLNQMNRLTLPGKLHAIELLSESFAAKESVVVERLERWRRSPYPSIKSAIHLYFARHGLFRPERVMHDLHSDSLELRAAAILTLRTTAVSHQFPSYCALAEEKLAALFAGSEEEEIIAGINILGLEGKGESIEQLFAFLRHPAPAVQRASSLAICRAAHPDWQPFGVKLASRLCYMHDAKSRLNSLRAIEKFANPDALFPLIYSAIHFRPAELKIVECFALEHGQQHQESLLQLALCGSKHERCRLIAGKAVAKLNPSLLREHLYQLAQRERMRAYFYFFHAHTIQEQIPQQDLSILADALLTGYHNVVDFIIQLIGAANAIEECEVLSQSLWSSNPKIRAQAIETLEKAASPRLFFLLYPLIAQEKKEERIENFLKLGGTPLSLSQLLEEMAKSPSPTDRIVSSGLKAKLNFPDWEQQWKKDREEIFRYEEIQLL